MECPQCSSPTAAGDRFCANCGATLSTAAPRAAAEAAPEPFAAMSGPPERSLRELYYGLGLKLLERGRAAEALPALEQANKEPGAEPAQSDMLLALGRAAQDSDHGEEAARHLLEASLVDAAPRREDIVRYVSGVLNARAALANGRWLIEQWYPEYIARTVSPGEAVRAQLLAARVHLFLANFEDAIKLVEAAAEGDAQLTGRNVARMLAPENLPPSLSDASADAAVVIARIWRAAGDFTQALAAADRALAAATGPGHRDAPIHALHGELLEQLGRADDAARSFFQAGRRYSWRNEPTEAVRVLQRSLELAPKNVNALWSLADALLFASYRPKLTAAARTELLERARAAWNEAYAIHPPGKSDAWAYATRAYIAVRSALFGSGPGGPPASWEAAALIERALLLTPEEPSRWSNLSEFHRDLINPQTALAAALRGVKLDSTAPEPLSDLLILQTNLGRWDDAIGTLAKLEALKKTAWTAFVGARLHLYSERPAAEALVRADEALQAEPDSLAYLQTRGMALRKLDRREESREIAQAIVRNRFDLDDRENLYYYGWGALECGEPTRAVQAFETDLGNSKGPSAREAAQRYLALARLADNDPGGARELFAEGSKGVIDSESRWLLLADMRDLEVFAESWGRRDTIAPVLAEFRRRVEGMPEAERSSARDELLAALAQAGGSSWQIVAAQAGLARLDCDRLDFKSAAERYADLTARWPAQFPEAALGLDAALDGLRKTTSVADYWAWRDATPQPQPWQQRFFASYLGARFKLAADAADAPRELPVITPIVVEMDASLVPAGDSKEWPILKRYLPAMREAIERDTGVTVPGVNLRSNEYGELSPNRLQIRLAEVPLLTPSVVHGAVYCLADAARVEALGARVLDSGVDRLDTPRAEEASNNQEHKRSAKQS